ncbi:prolyl-tRNA synthetase associated domain-containing protein [Arenibaculum pallidiluteum]|uniref:prolyl-tRNA synthetase associated domain-containing protein n=1 Tax=Arenibaculum pallidiluteum TaxID=2812559 RepID=UPI001A96239A|nr:prolyl-tRNA synthetase associated domain-containing protein [Arenibaculum pallidiluteum]
MDDQTREPDTRPTNAPEIGDASPPTSPEALLAYLDSLGIETETIAHRPLFTVEESREMHALIPGAHCKNLFLKDKKDQLWLVVALADTAVDLKRLDKRIGAARLSFGRPDLLWEALGVRPGSVTPFALVNDRAGRVRVVLERAMVAEPLLNYHPLVNTRSTVIRSEDLVRFVRATGHEPLIADLH